MAKPPLSPEGNRPRREGGIADILTYLETPATMRPLATYEPGHLDPAGAFLRDESDRLISLVHLGIEDGYPKTRMAKLLIDLSWASSRLEGNTYTQIDTQVLVQYGHRNTEKPEGDAVMILNHKRAIEAMLCQTDLSEEGVCAIHGLLADGRLAPDSRHFLPPDQCGAIRSDTPHSLEIDGSSYIPPQAEDRPMGFLNGEFARLVATARDIVDPVNAAFYVTTRLPYLQPFYGANKRTARWACNIPLIRAGLSPFSFVDIDKTQYIGGLIAFYELGDERLIKDAFLKAYTAPALRYRPWPERMRIALAHDVPGHVARLVRYVYEGGADNPLSEIGAANPPSSR